MASPDTPSPDPWYLRDFQRLADAVLERDAFLFSDEERAALAAVRSTPGPARLLLLRLAGRREGWLRRSRIHYPEVGDLDAAASALEETGWLERLPGAAIQPGELVATLTHEEISHLLRSAGQPVRGTAGQARRRLAALLDEQAASPFQLGLWGKVRPPAAAAREALLELDQWWRVRPGRRLLFRLLELAFFGNRHQDLRQFVLEEMGLLRWENVRPDSRGVFRSREEAERVLEAGRRLDRLQEGLDELRRGLRGWRRGKALPPVAARQARDLLGEAWALADPADLARRPRPERPQDGDAQERRSRLRSLLAGAALLERLGRPGAAAAWQRSALELGLEGRARGETWLRLVLNLRHSGRAESSAAACAQALGEPLGPLARRELELRAGLAAGLREAPRQQWRARRLPGHAGGRTLLEGSQGGARLVEEWALERFAAEGWRGLHAENALPRALVGLLAWPVVFDPVPGAFLHRCQTAPLDWGRPGFLERRAGSWAELRRSVEAGRHRSAALRRLRRKAGIQNPLVPWVVFDDGTERTPGDADLWRRGLEVLLRALPAQAVLEMVERILRDPAEGGHGWPDLLLWREDRRGRLLEWRWLEVKGPGDRLFQAQRLWLDWLLERGLPVGVLDILPEE